MHRDVAATLECEGTNDTIKANYLHRVLYFLFIFFLEKIGSKRIQVCESVEKLFIAVNILVKILQIAWIFPGIFMQFSQFMWPKYSTFFAFLFTLFIFGIVSGSYNSLLLPLKWFTSSKLCVCRGFVSVWYVINGDSLFISVWYYCRPVECMCLNPIKMYRLIFYFVSSSVHCIVIQRVHWYAGGRITEIKMSLLLFDRATLS